MKKVLENYLNRKNRNESGFTLVELMVVVAIVGILVTIAVPQYAKFQAKSKQAEAKITLGGAYSAESAFAVDNNSFSGCLINIGFDRDGNKFNYTVGFTDAAAATDTCGPEGNDECEAYSWTFAGGAWTTTAGTTCAPGGNVSHFMANQMDTGPLPDESLLGAVLDRTTFTISAVGNLRAALNDVWTIDQGKNVLNTTSGL